VIEELGANPVEFLDHDQPMAMLPAELTA